MADPVKAIRSLINKPIRAPAGYLTYNPGPGIYSRLERAVEAMPEMVRADELPGLLKRHKEGVPGWELKATDLDSVIAGRDVVPREELLARVRSSSPVYTHKEIVLGGNQPGLVMSRDTGAVLPEYQSEPSQLGRGVSHGEPRYQEYGHGGDNYAELLLLQSGQVGAHADLPGYGFDSHWRRQDAGAGDRAVAHARYDTHGDALRINELQSDLGIHNRKAREYADNNPQIHFGERLNPSESAGLPFPMEDNWSDLLIKRLALEAARQGHRAIEIASPRAIADKVGGNIENYEHFYGKVVPGAIERLGRKTGGMVADNPPPRAPGYDEAADAIYNRYDAPTGEALQLLVDARKDLRGSVPAFAHTPGDRFDILAHAARHGRPQDVTFSANALHQQIIDDMLARGAGIDTAKQRAAEMMPRLMRLAEDQAFNAETYRAVRELAKPQDAGLPGEMAPRRYIMSDEMRRRLIEQGVGASVLAPLLTTGGQEE